MKQNCQRCSNSEFEVPNFSQNEKEVLLELKSNNRMLDVILKVKSLYKLKFIDAKFSLMHLNLEYGKCHRCNYENLNGEYVSCPKCKSLNFNWKV